MAKSSLRILLLLAAGTMITACDWLAREGCDPELPNVSMTQDTGSITGGDSGSVTGGDSGSITGGDTGSITGGDSGTVSGDVVSFVAASGNAGALVIIRRPARSGRGARIDTLRLAGRKVTLTIR